MSLVVELQAAGRGRCLVGVAGRLDSRSHPLLEEKLNSVDWIETPTVVLDLQRLAHISSAGVRCIVKARKDGVHQGGHLVLNQPQGQVRKTLEIIKAIPPAEIFASDEELETYLANRPPKSPA